MFRPIEKHCPPPYVINVHQTDRIYYAVQVPPTQWGECYHSTNCYIWGHLEMTNTALGDLQVLPNIRCTNVNHATKPPGAMLQVVPGIKCPYCPYPNAIDGQTSLNLDPTGPKKRRVCAENGSGE